MKILKYTFISLFLGVIACTPNQSKEVKDVGDEVKEISQALTEDIKIQWSETQRAANNYKEQLDRRIEKLDNQIENSSEEAKVSLKEQRARFVEWRKGLSVRIQGMGNEIEEDWEEMIRETKEYFAELDKAIDS